MSPLPSAVLDLARRLGAGSGPAGHRAEFTQSGELRANADGRWMRFTARQWIALDQPAFDWKARIGPLGMITVRDRFGDLQPEASLRLLGVLPLNRATPSAALIKGELMRYLAELPWAPDAILHNDRLRWSAEPDGRLCVATDAAGVHAAVTFTLDDDGRVSAVDAEDRPRQEGAGMRERPWHGAFRDYREVAGRSIPHAAEVGWEVDGRCFTVWRGTLRHWRIVS